MQTVLNQRIRSFATDEDGKHSAYELSFDGKKIMKYGKYAGLAQKEDALKEGYTMKDHENEYWQDIAERSKPGNRKVKTTPQYSIDNMISLFPDDQKYWNLNKFTDSESIIHLVSWIFFSKTVNYIPYDPILYFDFLSEI